MSSDEPRSLPLDRTVFGVAAAAALAFVLFSGYLALSRYGTIKLGPDEGLHAIALAALGADHQEIVPDAQEGRSAP